jgi:hypothetical protein
MGLDFITNGPVYRPSAGFRRKARAAPQAAAYREGMCAARQTPGDQPSATQRVTFGLLVMTVGLIVLLRRYGVTDLRLSYHLWPLVPLAMGVAGFLSPGYNSRGIRQGRGGGLWLIFVGVWGLLNEYRLFGFFYDSSWPLLLIAGGLSIMWSAFEKRSGCAPVTDGSPRS